MAKKILKTVVQPSKLNFSSTIAVERDLYKQGMSDNSDFWNSEYGYLGDMAADAAAKPPEKAWYEKLVDVYGAYQAQRTAQKMQDQLARENFNRTSKGQQPLDMDSYARYASPQINVGVSPMVQNMLIYGGLGLAAILLLPKLTGKRR